MGKTANAELGRLTVTRPSTIGVAGLTQTSGTVQSVYSFGARSMSVWRADATLAADTGNQLERLTFDLDKGNFNKSNTAASLLDDRSDNKGPEPEGVAVGTVGGTSYAFLAAERAGSIFAYDLSDPLSPAVQRLREHADGRSRARGRRLRVADRQPDRRCAPARHERDLRDAGRPAGPTAAVGRRGRLPA